MPDDGLCPDCGTFITSERWGHCPECGATLSDDSEVLSTERFGTKGTEMVCNCPLPPMAKVPSPVTETGLAGVTTRFSTTRSAYGATVALNVLAAALLLSAVPAALYSYWPL